MAAYKTRESTHSPMTVMNAVQQIIHHNDGAYSPPIPLPTLIEIAGVAQLVTPIMHAVPNVSQLIRHIPVSSVSVSRASIYDTLS